MIIFISNLNKTTTLSEINDLFSSFGPVAKSRLMTNDLTKRSRGCAYLDIPDAAMAVNAIRDLDNSLFMGNTIEVKESSSRESSAIAWK
jgi:RNA recognition motif-containing protein